MINGITNPIEYPSKLTITSFEFPVAILLVNNVPIIGPVHEKELKNNLMLRIIIPIPLNPI